MAVMEVPPHLRANCLLNSVLEEATEVRKELEIIHMPAEPRLQRIEGVLDRVIIRRVGWKVLNTSASLRQHLLYSVSEVMVNRRVVHNNDRTVRKVGNHMVEELLREEVLRDRALYNKGPTKITVNRQRRQY